MNDSAKGPSPRPADATPPGGPSTPRRGRNPGRSWLLWTGVLLLGLLVVGALTARPAYRRVKVWRAATMTVKADEMLRQGRLDEAFLGYRSALELNAANLDATRGMARVLTTFEVPGALAYWRPVISSPGATDEDRDQYISLALRLKRFDLANEEIARLLQQSPPTDPALIHAMELFYLQADYRRASMFAEALWRRNTNDNRHALRLALAQLRLPNPTNKAFAVNLILGLTNLALPDRGYALSMLRQAPELPRQETLALLDSIRRGPTNFLADRLLSADIAIRLEPDRRQAIIEETLAAVPNPSLDDKGEIAVWLLVHGQPQRILQLITPADAQANGELLRKRLIALSADQRWEDIQKELANPGKMDPMAVDIFRAVTAQKLNQATLAAEHWRRASEKAGAGPDSLRRFASIALELKAYDQALPAVQALQKSPLDRLRTFRQLVEIYEAAGNPEGVRSVMRDWAADVPDDPTPRTAYVYLSGLLRKDVPEAEEQGRALVEKFPDRVAPRAALALVLLRRDNPAAALEQFARIRPDLDLVLPGWRAVYAAVLEANGQTDKARSILKPVKPAMLRPEERALVENLLPAA
ncbi:MAG: hypothetical protein ACKVYV_10455 [Limisphaerales bacterium]